MLELSRKFYNLYNWRPVSSSINTITIATIQPAKWNPYILTGIPSLSPVISWTLAAVRIDCWHMLEDGFVSHVSNQKRLAGCDWDTLQLMNRTLRTLYPRTTCRRVPLSAVADFSYSRLSTLSALPHPLWYRPRDATSPFPSEEGLERVRNSTASQRPCIFFIYLFTSI